jgi:hypothetical protein
VDPRCGGLSHRAGLPSNSCHVGLFGWESAGRDSIPLNVLSFRIVHRSLRRNPFHGGDHGMDTRVCTFWSGQGIYSAGLGRYRSLPPFHNSSGPHAGGKREGLATAQVAIGGQRAANPLHHGGRNRCDRLHRFRRPHCLFQQRRRPDLWLFVKGDIRKSPKHVDC